MVQTNSLLTDSGFFTESIDQTKYISLEELQADILVLNSAKRAITYNFFASNKASINRRKYIKITEIFGSLGGILNLVLLAFQLINYKFIKIQKVLDLSSKLNLNLNIEKKNLEKSFIVSNNFIKSLNNNNDSEPVEGDKRDSISNLNNKISLGKSLEKKNPDLSSNPITNTNTINKLKLTQSFALVDGKSDLTKLGIKSKLGKNYASLTKIIKLIVFKCKLNSKKENKLLEKFNFTNDKIHEMFEISEIFNRVEDINNLKRILLGNEISNLYNNIFYNDKKTKKDDVRKEDRNQSIVKLKNLIDNKNKNPIETRFCELVLEKQIKNKHLN